MSKLIVVDLGDLSQTFLGAHVKNASLKLSGDSPLLYIDTGVLQKDFSLKKNEPVGTMVIYDEKGCVFGTTRDVFSSGNTANGSA